MPFCFFFWLEKIKDKLYSRQWVLFFKHHQQPACLWLAVDLISKLQTPLVLLSWQRVLFHSSSHTSVAWRKVSRHTQQPMLSEVQKKSRFSISFFDLKKNKNNGWLHRTSKLHLDWISSSCFQQLFFSGTGQCGIQLWSHTLDMPAHWILSLLYHPFVSCISWKW